MRRKRRMTFRRVLKIGSCLISLPPGPLHPSPSPPLCLSLRLCFCLPSSALLTIHRILPIPIPSPCSYIHNIYTQHENRCRSTTRTHRSSYQRCYFFDTSRAADAGWYIKDCREYEYEYWLIGRSVDIESSIHITVWLVTDLSTAANAIAIVTQF